MKNSVTTHLCRAECRAAPKPAVLAHEVPTGHFMSTLTPSGDRPAYSTDEGFQ